MPRRSSDRKVLSDKRLDAKFRVTENRCVLFNSLTYVYLALLPHHRALYAKVDSTPTFIYNFIYIYIYIYIIIYIYIYIIRLKKKSYPFKFPRKALDCLPIILIRVVRSINLTFARYSPVLEIQKDRILFWFYLLRDHSKRVSVASFDKQIKLKYPFVKTKSIESQLQWSHSFDHDPAIDFDRSEQCAWSWLQI